MKKPNLSTNIFSTLKHRIIRWGYPPGYRLTEEVLCQEFGVSRAPVREALRMLQEHDLVDTAPNRGCAVKQPSLSEVHELYDVRLALELFVVAQLAQHGMDQPVWQTLYDTWAALLGSEEDAELDELRLAHQDAAFHEALAEATANRQLYDYLRQIDERLYFTRMTDITTVERLHVTCRHHLHILECIRQGDAGAAQAAIRANIDFGRSNVEDALKEALARAHWRTAGVV